jgi:hypothetical protein
MVACVYDVWMCRCMHGYLDASIRILGSLAGGMPIEANIIARIGRKFRETISL